MILSIFERSLVFEVNIQNEFQRRLFQSVELRELARNISGTVVVESIYRRVMLTREGRVFMLSSRCAYFAEMRSVSKPIRFTPAPFAASISCATSHCVCYRTAAHVNRPAACTAVMGAITSWRMPHGLVFPICISRYKIPGLTRPTLAGHVTTTRQSKTTAKARLVKGPRQASRVGLD